MIRNVYGYGRASTDRQVLSTEQQEAVVLREFEHRKAVRPDWKDACWMGFQSDTDTCRLTRFREREVGSRLIALAQRGDVILASNYDRVYGSTLDMCESFDYMEKSGVAIIPADLDLDPSTPMGQVAFKLLSIIKEFEVHEIRRRIGGALAHLKTVGRPHTNRAIPGWKRIAVLVRGKRCWYYKRFMEGRKLAEQIVAIKESKGLSINALVKFCNTHGLLPMDEGIPVWSRDYLLKTLEAAKAGFPLPNGSHEPAPIPYDAKPCHGYPTISRDHGAHELD